MPQSPWLRVHRNPAHVHCKRCFQNWGCSNGPALLFYGLGMYYKSDIYIAYDKARRAEMRTRFCVWLCVSAMAIALTGSASSQQGVSRVALVIGNADYPEAGTPLPTTINDVRALADQLHHSDFQVDLKENVGKAEMQRAVDAFAGKISSGTAALIYFAGFGIQVARQNYLIPVDAQISNEADVQREGISVDAILAQMQRQGAHVKIVILDASRDNPFEHRFRQAPSGLAALAAPDNTLALYSELPGKVISDGTDAHSLFAGQLIKEMQATGLSAEDAFNKTRIEVSRASNNAEIPWVSSSLLQEFAFAPGNTTSAPPPSPGPANPPSTPPKPATYKPGDVFRDCPECGEMVVVPAGSFDMGAHTTFEEPVHRVTIAKPFAVGRYLVTFREWDLCIASGGCKFRPDDQNWGRGNRPVIDVSWLDAKDFLKWLSDKTGQVYRLPSEAEWEYAARAGTKSTYWWGRDIGTDNANCRNCGTGGNQTFPVGTFKPNPFGLFDTAGNAAEWVEDCWNDDYRHAPHDGSALTTGQCQLRVLRGGAFDSDAKYVASAARFRYDYDVRYLANGFRVVREMP